MARELLVVGAGGGSRELIGFLPELNAALPVGLRWEIRGVLDDDESLAGTQVSGVPVLGPLTAIDDHPSAFISIGIASSRDVTIRRRVFERLAQPSDRYAVMIHPRAYVSFNADIEPGCIVYPHVAIGPGAVLSRNSVAYFNSVIHHDSVIGSHSMLCAGVHVAGGVMLGSCVYAGISATVRDGIRVGDDTLIGMGSVVTRDVAAGRMVFGVPARERQPVVEPILA